MSLGTKIASNRIAAAEKRAASVASPRRAVADRSSASSESTRAAGAEETNASDAPPRDGALAAGRGSVFGASAAGAPDVGANQPGLGGSPGSRVLFVPVGVRFQEAASHKPIDETALFQAVGVDARGRGRVGKSQQQGADLGAGEFPVRQRGGDRVQRPAFPLAVEREPIELGEFAVEFASIAPRPGAFRVARQQRDAADPQSVCVAFNRAGAQPEVARERQTAHLVLH